MHKVLLAALLAVVPVSMSAQRGGFGYSAHFSPAHNGGFFSGTHNGHFARRNGYIPFFDPLYADYLSTGYPVASDPPAVIMQTPPAPAHRERFPAPAQPLLIELRGDHYIQISGSTESSAQTIDEPIAPGLSSVAPKYKVTSLHFRDGHQEEVSNYAIVGGVLYASADYATAGAWVRKVDLTALNLPETIAANQSRGLQFRIPQAPNEVIVGP